ncbi:MAG: hypothetical protein E7074_04445 [Bacteroidales bacterium]|jgi:hypothetical protein|nr:hypothetical protein [Bacteroidales bacterium]
MMQIVVIEEGGVKCSSACPFYEEGGVVKCYGGPKRSHCRAIMEPWSFDCNKFNPKRMWKLKATEAQFKAMVKSQGLHAIRQKKLLPYDHQPSLQIGESGRTKGKRPENRNYSGDSGYRNPTDSRGNYQENKAGSDPA